MLLSVQGLINRLITMHACVATAASGIARPFLMVGHTIVTRFYL